MVSTTNPELLRELRELIRGGKSTVDAMRFLIERLQLGPESRLQAIWYFQQAFDAPLGEVSTLGAWEFFNGGSWSNEAINMEVTPVLLQQLKMFTARLQLRRLRLDDAEALCSYRSLPEVARFQYWESFGPDDAARLIETQSKVEPNVSGTWFQLAIVKTDTGSIIGDCGLHCPKDDPRQMEIGITLSPRYQGRRYADEAVECLLEYCFTSLDKHRVFAYIDVENRSAIALCSRMNLRQEAHFLEHRWFKNRWQSEYVFAILKREWENAPAKRIFDARGDFSK